MVSHKRRRSIFDTEMQGGLTLEDFTSTCERDRKVAKFFGLDKAMDHERLVASISKVFDQMNGTTGFANPAPNQGTIAWPTFAAYCAGLAANRRSVAKGGGGGGGRDKRSTVSDLEGDALMASVEDIHIVDLDDLRKIFDE